MTYSLVFLAAACMVADDSALRPVPADAGAPHVIAGDCGCGSEHQGCLQRWFGNFHHKSCGCETPCASPCPKPCASPCSKPCASPCPRPCDAHGFEQGDAHGLG